MAIKRGIIPQLAEIGKIKIGMKGAMIKSAKGNDFQPPKKTDYFIITTTERNRDTGNFIINEELMNKMAKNPEGKLTEIKIRLPFDTVDRNFYTSYMAYSGNKKICYGDGEKALRRGNVSVDKTGKLTITGDEKNEVTCDFETCPIAQAGKCKPSGILSAFIPESGDLGGVFKFRTHSWNSISSILGSLEFFSNNTGGILFGIPLKLLILKKTTEEHGTIVYCTVVLDTIEMAGLRKCAIEENQNRKLLNFDMKKIEAQAEASGFFEDTDDPEEVQAEFYEVETEPEEKGVSGAKLADLVSAKNEQAEKVVIGEPVKTPIENAKEKAEELKAKTVEKEPVKQEEKPAPAELDIF